MAVTLSDFSYENTTKVIFDDVYDLIGDVELDNGTLIHRNIQYILVEIYSYSLITSTKILQLQELRSSLTECFYPNTSLIIGGTQLAIYMMATGLC